MRRAIGIVRVSQVGGREGESFASPGEQRDRIVSACEREGLELIDVLEELDVSGRAPLEKRHGLRAAIEAVESGDAEVVVAAYFDRLVRSLKVQEQLVARVEAGGGEVLALDSGRVTHGTAAQWLSSTFLGLVSEHQARAAGERTADAQARAVARGAVPWPRIPPGYDRGRDGVLEPNSIAGVVADAFRLRADGATVAEVRSFLADRGVRRSYHGVSTLLASRVVLGEIAFGKLVNPHAHEAIVDAELWRRVQRMRVGRGRQARSTRLLARLDVLRCASCGGRMVVGLQTQNGRSYPYYRCGRVREDCPQRMVIGAEIVELVVTDHVQRALTGIVGRASADVEGREAEEAAERAQANLDAAIRAFGGVGDELAAVERLAELRRVRDDAREHAGRLRGLRSALVVTASGDWESLSLEARRGLIRAVVARVLVGPGRGAGRVRVELVE
jgi:DNA invertase Pin-like site-specific DNA recombinase